MKESEGEKVKGAKRSSGVDLVSNDLTRSSLAGRTFQHTCWHPPTITRAPRSLPCLRCQVPPYRSQNVPAVCRGPLPPSLCQEWLGTVEAVPCDGADGAAQDKGHGARLSLSPLLVLLSTPAPQPFSVHWRVACSDREWHGLRKEEGLLKNIYAQDRKREGPKVEDWARLQVDGKRRASKVNSGNSIGQRERSEVWGGRQGKRNVSKKKEIGQIQRNR